MPAFEYRKSSYSDFDNECLEIATNVPIAVAIRDSKNPAGPSIAVTAAAWKAFRNALADEADDGRM